MATNHYFHNFSQTKTNEQRLYEDLLVESIRMHGHNIYYLPREDWDDRDTLFGENIQSKFKKAYIMEMYIANVEGFSGDQDFFSRFGLEMRDNSNFIVAKKTFEKYMPSNISRRPKEGDLLFVPVMNRIFEIVFVEEENLFFSKGNRVPYIYEIRAEAFRYANEVIETGVEIIDDIDAGASYTLNLTLSTGSGNYFIGEHVYQGTSYATANASAKVSNWDRPNNIISLYDVAGIFQPSANLVGNVSSTIRSVVVLDSLGDNVYYDQFDNKLIQSEANTIIDTTESNPFGAP